MHFRWTAIQPSLRWKDARPSRLMWTGHKALESDMVLRNLHEAYLLEVGLTHFMANHETISIVCHLEIHMDFSSIIKVTSWFSFTQTWMGACSYVPCSCLYLIHDSFFGTLGLHLIVWSELGRSWPFRQMRGLRMPWSQAFSPVCDVTLIPTTFKETWMFKTLMRADHIGHFWHHLSASPVVIMWKGVSQHIYLNITPNNFTARTGWKVSCDRAWAWWREQQSMWWLV